jgi:hypothetical protein
MNVRIPLHIIFFVVLYFGPSTVVEAQEEVIASRSAGECSLSFEANLQWQTLRLRAHHPEGRNCLIEQEAMMSMLHDTISGSKFEKLESNFTSLSIGRLIDFPWLSQYLAAAAAQDSQWNARKGRPLTGNDNHYVSDVLSRKEVLAIFQAAIASSRYQIQGVSVEKVLVGGLQEVPGYGGKLVPGRFPYDAQVWFQLKKGEN